MLELAAAGVFIGVVLRTAVPFLRRLEKGEKWEDKYTATAIISILVGVLSAAQAVIATLPPGTDLIGGIFLGMGVNTFLNETVKRA